MKRSLLNEHKAWQKYKQWQKKNASSIREGQQITSLGEFKSIYNQNDRRLRNVQNRVKYQTDYETRLALNRSFKRELGRSLTAVERGMSTQQLAEQIKDQIYKYMDELEKDAIANGTSLSAKDKKLAVSSYFFGS